MAILLEVRPAIAPHPKTVREAIDLAEGSALQQLFPARGGHTQFIQPQAEQFEMLLRNGAILGDHIFRLGRIGWPVIQLGAFQSFNRRINETPFVRPNRETTHLAFVRMTAADGEPKRTRLAA